MPDKPKPPAAQTAVQKESRAAATIPQYPASTTSTAPTKEIVGGRTRAWSSSMQVLELSDRQEGVISPKISVRESSRRSDHRIPPRETRPPRR